MSRQQPQRLCDFANRDVEVNSNDGVEDWGDERRSDINLKTCLVEATTTTTREVAIEENDPSFVFYELDDLSIIGS